MIQRVLVVDDNLELAENLAEILSDEGYEAHVAGGPQAALEAARRFDFDAAVIDVRMPGMDGVTLHAELARLRPHATFVLMTAYTRDERIEEALRSGVRAVLPKPIPMEELLAELPRPGGEGAEILVVEDEPGSGDSLAEALALQGFVPIRAASLAAARRQILVRRPAAAIVDLRLPDGDGADLARELGALGDVPVVIVTAYETDRAEEVLAQYYGARGRLLTKPFSTEALLDALRAVRRRPS